MKTLAMGIAAMAVFLIVTASRCASSDVDTTVYDRDVRVVDFADLRYPPVVEIAHIQGVVVIRVKLDEQGQVTATEAISGESLLIPACLENAKKWHFKPNPLKTAIIVYNFRIEGECHRGERSSQMTFYPPNFASIIGCELNEYDRPTAEPK
jgi:TonB family protein